MKVKVVPIQMAKGKNKLTIYFLGDIHEGAANMQQDAFRSAVKIIAADGDYWLGLGDYVDCINHLDKRFNCKEIASHYGIQDLDDLPRVQADNFLKDTKPIWSKCLGLIMGNHEDKYMQTNTFDVNAYLCKGMGCDNLRHKAWICLSFIREKENPSIQRFSIVACHGTGGGGMREGFPLNKTYDVFKYDVADIHVMGHLHKMVDDRANRNVPVRDNIRKDPVIYAVNGCFLSKSEVDTDGYFEQRPGKESDIGMLKLTIETDAKNKSDAKIHIEKIYLG